MFNTIHECCIIDIANLQCVGSKSKWQQWCLSQKDEVVLEISIPTETEKDKRTGASAGGCGQQNSDIRSRQKEWARTDRARQTHHTKLRAVPHVLLWAQFPHRPVQPPLGEGWAHPRPHLQAPTPPLPTLTVPTNQVTEEEINERKGLVWQTTYENVTYNNVVKVTKVTENLPAHQAIYMEWSLMIQSPFSLLLEKSLFALTKHSC